MAFEFFSKAEVLNDQSKSLKDSIIMNSCGRIPSQPQAGFFLVSIFQHQIQIRDRNWKETRDGDGRRVKKRFYTWVGPWLQGRSRDGKRDATLQIDLGQSESTGCMDCFLAWP